MGGHIVRRAIAIGALLLSLAGGSAQAKDDLVIGVAQFPSSLHPNIDAEAIKGYVVAFALRPITSHDKDWKMACLLCAELPDAENGLAKLEDLPGGGQGMAVTIKLKPDLKWSDGQPVTTKDLVFTWKVGRDPNSGFSNNQSMEPCARHRRDRRSHRCAAPRQGLGLFRPLGRNPAEHIEGPVYAKVAGPGDYIKQTTYNRAPTTPGPVQWSLHDHGLSVGDAYRAGAEPVLGRSQARLQAHRHQADRQHRRIAGEPAVGRRGHGQRRGRRPHHRPGDRATAPHPDRSPISSSRA